VISGGNTFQFSLADRDDKPLEFEAALPCDFLRLEE
jgi:hypothetical protein